MLETMQSHAGKHWKSNVFRPQLGRPFIFTECNDYSIAHYDQFVTHIQFNDQLIENIFSPPGKKQLHGWQLSQEEMWRVANAKPCKKDQKSGTHSKATRTPHTICLWIGARQNCIDRNSPAQRRRNWIHHNGTRFPNYVGWIQAFHKRQNIQWSVVTRRQCDPERCRHIICCEEKQQRPLYLVDGRGRDGNIVMQKYRYNVSIRHWLCCVC